jgi:hypothetical protein
MTCPHKQRNALTISFPSFEKRCHGLSTYTAPSGRRRPLAASNSTVPFSTLLTLQALSQQAYTADNQDRFTLLPALPVSLVVRLKGEDVHSEAVRDDGPRETRGGKSLWWGSLVYSSARGGTWWCRGTLQPGGRLAVLPLSWQ